MNPQRLILITFGMLLLTCLSSCADQKPAGGSTSNETSEPSLDSTDKANGSTLTSPITLVDAGEFADGGTTFVRLKDANQRELLICVSASAFAEVIPANTLFLNASHPQAPTARLPISNEEANSILSTLETAMKTAFPPSVRKDFEQWGDPLEHYWNEKYGKPQSEQRSADDWKKIFAIDALRRLKAKPDLATLDGSNSTEPDWYKAYDKERRERLAEKQRFAEADADFKRFYPEDARELFAPPNTPDQIQVQPVGADSGSEDNAIVQQGKRLAEAIGNPVLLAQMSSKAFGTLHHSWTYSTTRDRVAIQAMLTVSPDNFAAALPKVANDKRALLGASRFFFYDGYANKLPAPIWEKWAPVLSRVVLEDGEDGNKRFVIQALARSDHGGAMSVLRQVARGEIGVERNITTTQDEEPGLKESAYLALALKSDETVRQEITTALAEAKLKQNIAALEVSLALLGNPAYLTKQNMELNSYSISFAALRAIERFGGKRGMDLLMSSGLDHDYAAVANEALLTAQRITGEVWIPDGSRSQPRNYKDEAKAWWKANRDSFERKNSP